MGMVISHSVEHMKGEATARWGAWARCSREHAAASCRSSELSSSSTMYSFSCALCTGSLCSGKSREGGLWKPSTKDLCLFMSFLLLGTQTDFERLARKMNTQDIALCYFAVKLVFWMKIFNSFESKCITSLEVEILLKSQRKEGWWI